MAIEDRTSNMRSLDRAIDVLEALQDAPRGLRLSDVAQATGLPAATTLRILNALLVRGMVEHDGTHYRVGMNLLFGAHAYLSASPLVLAARGDLQDLAVATRLAASVFVRNRMSRVVIARVEGADPLRYELPIGERLPLHLGGGKVLLAQLPTDDQTQAIQANCPFSTVGGVVVTADQFRDELALIRLRGFAVAESERVLGGRSVSAPVIDGQGVVIAAIQVAGTQESLPRERTNAVAAMVQEAALRLGNRL